MTKKRVENENGEETHKEVENDILDDSEHMKTPQEGGDVPSTSSSKKVIGRKYRLQHCIKKTKEASEDTFEVGI